MLEADGSADADNASDFANEILYCGYRRDAESGLYCVRYRYYHPRLGRWISRDPAGYVDGMDLFLYSRANPVNYPDPLGLISLPITGGPPPHYVPNEGSGPFGMACAYFTNHYRQPRLSYGEGTELVDSVKGSTVYGVAKDLFRGRAAREATAWGKQQGRKEACGTIGPFTHDEWVGFPGYYLGGMLGVSKIVGKFTCCICQTVSGRNCKITGSCSVSMSIDDTWNIGGNPDSHWYENFVGWFGTPIHQHLEWNDTFEVSTSRLCKDGTNGKESCTTTQSTTQPTPGT